MTDRKKQYLCFLAGLGFALLMLKFGFLDRILDARFYFTGLEAERYLAALDADSKDAYFRQELFDLGFISSYSGFLFFWMKRTWASPGHRERLWIAFVPGFFDLAETLGILFVLISGKIQLLENLGFATGLKWSSGALLILTLLSTRVQQSLRKPTP